MENEIEIKVYARGLEWYGDTTQQNRTRDEGLSGKMEMGVEMKKI